MRIATFAAAALAVALALSACGSTTKYVAGSPQATAQVKKGLNDPRPKHIACLRAAHVTDIREYSTGGLPAFQVGTRPSGPTVIFYATPGIAQGNQIQGENQGAEAIGSADVYPNLAPARLAHAVERCVALGVSG
jgi:hypothetical protein